MSNMGKVLKIFIAVILPFAELSQGYSKRFYQLNINERGTSFNESIEIDDVKERIVYRVPSHNDIKKTDTFIDYKNGHFVTKMDDRKECYIKAFPIANEQSIRETRQNLELLQLVRKRSKNATIPVETVTTMMKVIREIPREELSPEVLGFCGDNTPYQVKEEILPQKKGKSIVKRTQPGPVLTNTYSLQFPSVMSGTVKKILPNGYLTCDPVKEHTKALFDCLDRGKTPLVGCGEYPITCRYKAICKVAGKDDRKVAAPNQGRDTNIYHWVDIVCVEQHRFTVNYCCDVLPCS